jgi:hypothetical protein
MPIPLIYSSNLGKVILSKSFLQAEAEPNGVVGRQ